jgi:hypothetical protein
MPRPPKHPEKKKVSITLDPKLVEKLKNWANFDSVRNQVV